MAAWWKRRLGRSFPLWLGNVIALSASSPRDAASATRFSRLPHAKARIKNILTAIDALPSPPLSAFTSSFHALGEHALGYAARLLYLFATSSFFFFFVLICNTEKNKLSLGGTRQRTLAVSDLHEERSVVKVFLVWHFYRGPLSAEWD